MRTKSRTNESASRPLFSLRASRIGEVAASTVALLAVALWMGGLLALGALAAPVVFAVVPLPTSADAMTIVFRRFDEVAMGSAAIAVATEAVRTAMHLSPGRIDRARVLTTLLAAAAAVFEGTCISPRIAQMHAEGVLRGAGPLGAELSRLHGFAEACGQAQIVLLALVVALHVLALSRPKAVRSAP